MLYLHVGDPATAVDFDASPEGHALRYDAAGRLVGLTLVHARRLLARDGRITVTLPPPARGRRPGARRGARPPSLTRFGRDFCTPACPVCPLNDLCAHFRGQSSGPRAILPARRRGRD